MYKVVIIDDEQSGREVLSQLLASNKDISIVGFGESAESGIAAIVEHKPDIVFLDIEMPNGTGFNVLDNDAVRDINFRVIFTTAFEKYALKAIKYAALDYILKPIDKNELNAALQKVIVEKQTAGGNNEWIEDLKTAFNKSSRLKLISKDGFDMVDVNSIVYIKADANYTMFYFDDGTSKLISKTMKIFQLYLEQHGFLRIHRSHIINTSKMSKYQHGKGGQVVMTNKAVLDVGPDYKKTLMDALENL